jgi:hypothetical protein
MLIILCTCVFFFVPNRLVWNNWERFNGEQDHPGASTDFNIPQMQSFTPDINSVADYFGLPITGKALSGMESMAEGIIRNRSSSN